MDPTKRVIYLTDGSALDIKVNFATIYWMNEIGMISNGEIKDLSGEDEIDIMAKLIYVILCSNGRRVSFEEAIELMPIDETAIQDTIEEFQIQMQRYNKKKEARSSMKKHIVAN